MLKSMNFLSGKSRGRAKGGTKLTSPAPVILGPVPRILLQGVSNLVNKLALLLHKCWEREDSWDKPKNDWCWGCGFSAFNTFTIKAMSILAFVCLFATAAEAKICFLPVDGCDTKIITKVKDDNASSCQYDSQYKAEQGISACEIAYSPDKSQRKKKCWYRMCNTQNKNIFSTYEDCKNNLTDSQKCESCGSCYKRVAG